MIELMYLFLCSGHIIRYSFYPILRPFIIIAKLCGPLYFTPVELRQQLIFAESGLREGTGEMGVDASDDDPAFINVGDEVIKSVSDAVEVLEDYNLEPTKVDTERAVNDIITERVVDDIISYFGCIFDELYGEGDDNAIYFMKHGKVLAIEEIDVAVMKKGWSKPRISKGGGSQGRSQYRKPTIFEKDSSTHRFERRSLRSKQSP